MPEFENRGHETQPEKTVKMPSKEEMISKIRKADLLGASLIQGERLFSTFVNHVAGKNKGASGINLAWEVAKFDALSGVTPLMAERMEMEYEPLVQTVTPDPDVANRAMELRREMLEKRKKEQGK